MTDSGPTRQHDALDHDIFVVETGHMSTTGASPAIDGTALSKLQKLGREGWAIAAAVPLTSAPSPRDQRDMPVLLFLSRPATEHAPQAV